MTELSSLAILAFITNIIIEMTKDIPVLKKLPTRLYAVVVSMVVCFISVIVAGTAITLQVAGAMFINAFLVAYIAIFGYDNVFDVFKKYVQK